jgi:hypothetical protein
MLHSGFDSPVLIKYIISPQTLVVHVMLHNSLWALFLRAPVRPMCNAIRHQLAPGCAANAILWVAAPATLADTLVDDQDPLGEDSWGQREVPWTIQVPLDKHPQDGTHISQLPVYLLVIVILGEQEIVHLGRQCDLKSALHLQVLVLAVDLDSYVISDFKIDAIFNSYEAAHPPKCGSISIKILVRIVVLKSQGQVGKISPRWWRCVNHSR